MRLLIRKRETVAATHGARRRESQLILGLIEKMLANYEERWTAARMIAATGLGQTRLFAAFKRQTGRSPVSWLIDLRLEHARRLLHTTRRPVTEVAAACGFDDPNCFARIFHLRTGLTPRAFRKAGGIDGIRPSARGEP